MASCVAHWCEQQLQFVVVCERGCAASSMVAVYSCMVYAQVTRGPGR
ncbi:MAG TPA: hypothetical protein VFU35_02715 [Jatrophihabitans sp.]|nr:hypothetical protein [Jatrophihabitans sp.]